MTKVESALSIYKSFSNILSEMMLFDIAFTIVLDTSEKFKSTMSVLLDSLSPDELVFFNQHKCDGFLL